MKTPNVTTAMTTTETRRPFSTVAALSILSLLALLLLAGCGGGVDANATATAVAVSGAATESAATAQARIPTPTATPTDVPMVATARVESQAVDGVTVNADWSPVEREIDGVSMVLVPAGCYQMGSSERGRLTDGPAHRQCLDAPYWIDKTEVTLEQFRAINADQEPDSALEESGHPVTGLTWFDADAFCERRDASLPTEVEWEYAARGPSSLLYPWGNTFFGTNMVYSVNGSNRTANVGSRPGGVSWVGAFDLLGNVKEWTRSQSADYPYDASDGREANDGGRIRVLWVVRGGSFTSTGVDAAWRAASSGERTARDVGFRCVRPFEGS